jgi:hypothetical protein
MSNTAIPTLNTPVAEGIQDIKELALRIPGMCNERAVYRESIAGFQLGIRRGARSFQLRRGFIKQN